MKILFNGYQNLLPPRNGHHYGGPQSFTNSFINYLKQKTNHTFTAIILRSDQRIKGSDLKIKKTKEGPNNWLTIRANLKIKKIIKASTTTLPYGYQAIIKKLTAEIKNIQPDVILFNGFSVPNWYLLKAAHQSGLPILVAHHGLWFKDIQATGQLYSNSGKKLALKMEKDIYLLADQQIFFNDFSQKIFTTKIGGFFANKINYLPLPYNTVYLNKKKPATANSKILKIGLIGRWDNIKNHRAFWQLAKTTTKQKLPWKFYSVTHWPDNKPLNNLQKKYKKHIQLVGQMTPAKLKKFYQSMNLLVLPSHFDVSPTVVMEAALQNRLTLISANVGWVSIYKKFGLNKLIANFNQPKQIINLIKNNTKQPAPTKFYNYIKTQHHPSEVFKKYLKLASLAKK
ncbi:glycosyltransferase [Patescibacteria group bacterium]|nr:glycosyltransferase [Patescibacteria group bacterium]